ncbi:MAG TPA: hypothetical protein VGH83_03935 [Candidatus Acidoferrum sp.]|jgi:hypothetical protein
MKILGPFVSVEDPDTFFFMRGFPNLAAREPMKAKFYQGQLWKQELENVLMPMLEKHEVVLVKDPESQDAFEATQRSIWRRHEVDDTAGCVQPAFRYPKRRRSNKRSNQRR